MRVRERETEKRVESESKRGKEGREVR